MESAQGSEEERVAAAITVMDSVRLDNFGGYPSDWLIDGGRIYIATIDHNGAPTLIVTRVKTFLEKYDEALSD